MIRKIVAILLISLFALLPTISLANSNIKVIVDEKQLDFDIDPFLENGRTLVEFRTIFTALNMEINWNQETRTVTGEDEDTKLLLTLDSKIAYVNDKTIKLDVSPTVINGRTVVPLRFVSESVRANVEWDDSTKTITVESLDYRIRKDLEEIFKDTGNIPPPPNFVDENLEQDNAPIIEDVNVPTSKNDKTDKRNERTQEFREYESWIHSKIAEVRSEGPIYRGTPAEFDLELAQKQDELLELRRKQNLVMFDDTIEGRKKKRELESQITKLENEIKELLAEMGRKKEINGLENLLEEERQRYMEAIRNL